MIDRGAVFVRRAPAADLVTPQDPIWEAVLSRVRHAVYHLPAYHAAAGEAPAMADGASGSPYMIVVSSGEQGLAWPYLLRAASDLPGLEGSSATDVTSVYGYPGPLAWGCDPTDPFVGRALELALDAWRQQGAVCAFTRFHPLLGNVELVSAWSGRGGSEAGRDPVRRHGRTVSIDLRPDPGTIRSAYGRDLRRRIDRARRSGLVTSEDREWRYLSTFARLYRKTMVRAGAQHRYLFDADHFARRRRALGDRLHLLVTMLEADVAAAGLFTECDGLVEWHLVGSDPRFTSLSPVKLLVDDAVVWARARGSDIMHIGGGRGGREDSLFWFKSRFSPARHDFSTGSWVLDPAAYRELVRARVHEPGTRTDGDPDYFPGYRTAYD